MRSGCRCSFSRVFWFSEGAMAELFSNLALGFGVAFTPVNLLLCLIGALVGTLVGVLPGIGTIATVAMLLPITFGLPPVGALIMLAGIYYGAQYGGSTTSILGNIPGEATSVVTTLDGFQMAKQGRAGPALAIAAIGSFFAGCVATVLIAVLGAPLTKLALAFGPAEYFSLMVLGLIFAVVLAKGSVLKAIAMIVFGLLLSMVGSDIETRASRMAFNIPELADGLGVRKRQERGRPDLVHSVAHARHSAQRRHGPDGRRHDHSWHRAGTAGDAEAARTGLGHDRLDVDRQSDADHHQLAAGWHLGAAAAGAVSPDVPLDRDLLRDRHLLHQQCPGGRRARRRVRPARLLADQA